MISFKTFVLSEAGDKPYDFHLDGDDDEETMYKFKAGDTDYNTTITHHHDGKHAEVVFGTSHHDDDFGDHTEFHLTGDKGTKAAKVMSTIHHIVKRHIAKHPEIETVGFTSDTDEPSRVSLYKRYTKRLGGTTHDSSHAYDTMVHTIPAESYRDKTPIKGVRS